MEINSTLFLQIIHVGIAYLIIDKIFLRSAVHTIFAQDEREKRERQEQAELEQSVMNKTGEKQTRGAFLQQLLKTGQPDLEQATMPERPVFVLTQPRTLQPEHLARRVQEVARDIVRACRTY